MVSLAAVATGSRPDAPTEYSYPGPHSPFIRDDAPEGLGHAHALVAHVELLPGLDDVQGVEELRVGIGSGR